jgi:C-terminal processing protease CtpA/Prc
MVGTEPTNRWTKPSIVVMSEGNYSDAHCFPMAYTQLGLGQTVGMAVAGTCTSVWWERLQDRDLTFGIPEVSLLDMQGDVMENKPLAPDYVVEPDPAMWAAGRDQQLEKGRGGAAGKVAEALTTAHAVHSSRDRGLLIARATRGAFRKRTSGTRVTRVLSKLL